MEIKPSEIDRVENIGHLDNGPVRMIRTMGGFWVAIGRPKGKKKDEALAAGSHPAIVKYNVEKAHPDFQPILAKSESFIPEANIVGFSELLPKKMRDKGYDLLMLEKSEETSFVLTKFGNEVNSYSAKLKEDSLAIFKSKVPINKETVGFSKAVASAAATKALSEGKSYIEHDGSRFDAAKIVSRG
jgi:hypothetical protein